MKFKPILSALTLLTLIVSFFVIAPSPVMAQNSSENALNVLFWNVESGGNRSSVIASQLRDMVQENGPFDLVGLTEVQSSNSNRYKNAIGEDFISIRSNSGRSDRMLILFNPERFELVESEELDEFDDIALNFFSASGQPRFRSPLVAKLQDKATSENFLFMVNHLARNNGGNENGGFREQQAQGLVAWAEIQSLPVLMGGDLNLDFDILENAGNSAFRILFGNDDSDDQEFTWVRPTPLVDTNYTDENGEDRFPDSILDFVTVANWPAAWTVSESEVIVRDGDFPDNSRTSDHRPVRALFNLSR